MSDDKLIRQALDALAPTMDEQATAQEGQPIGSGRVVFAQLVEAGGVVSESWEITGQTDPSEIARWAGQFIACMASEGMAGSITWEARTAIKSDETWDETAKTLAVERKQTRFFRECLRKIALGDLPPTMDAARYANRALAFSVPSSPGGAS